MSTRQNKKQRKGRNNAKNRERTVTTLTEDPNTPYLVPKPSEEPAGSHISAQFGGQVGGIKHNMPLNSQAFLPGNYAFGYTPSFGPVQHNNMQHRQQQPPPPFFSSLATSLPKPPAPALPPGKNDLEILQNLKKIIKDGQHPFYRAVPAPAALASLYKGTIPKQNQTETSGLPTFEANQQARTQGKEPRTASANLGRSQELLNAPQRNDSLATLKLEDLQIGSNQSSAPTWADSNPGLRSRESWTVKPADAPAGADVSGSQHPGKYGFGTRTERKGSDSMDVETGSKDLPSGSTFAVVPGKDVPSLPGAKAPHEGVLTDDHDFFKRDTMPNPYSIDTGVDFSSRSYSPSGRPLTPNPYSSNPYLDDNGLPRTWHPNPNLNERRVIYERPRDLPSEALHKPFAATESGAAKALGSSIAATASLEERRPEVPPLATTDSHEHTPNVSDVPAREPDAVRPPIVPQPKHDVRPDSNVPPAATEHLASDVDDIQSSRGSSVSPADTSAAVVAAPDVILGEDPIVPDDITIVPPPSLKERINQSAVIQVKARDEAAPPGSEHHPHPHGDRFSKRGKFQKVHHPGVVPGRFGRQGSSVDLGPPGARTFRPRSPSYDARNARDYQGPPRPVSRDRGNYRPEFHDRRPEGVETDGPPPARYDGRNYSEFPAPLGNDRRPSTYTGSPPPMSAGRGPPMEGPPGRGDYYPQYPPGRGEWEMEDDYYKSRGWPERPPPGAERELFEREVYTARSASWDVRPEREFIPRDGYSPLAGPPSDDRYIPGPPLSRAGNRASHITVEYNPPYNRVRPRSPSPMGAGPMDDARPPMKRAREEYPPEYYSGGRAPPRRTQAPEYPPRVGPHTTSDWPPPSSGSSVGMGGLPPSGGSRDYRMEYAPTSYERPRSPPRPPQQYLPSRGGYARGNERGGYGMRPPQ